MVKSHQETQPLPSALLKSSPTFHQQILPCILTESHIDDVEGEDIDREEGEREDKEVEVTVVPLSNTIPHPGAVMVEALCGRKRVQCQSLQNKAQHAIHIVPNLKTPRITADFNYKKNTGFYFSLFHNVFSHLI